MKTGEKKLHQLLSKDMETVDVPKGLIALSLQLMREKPAKRLLVEKAVETLRALNKELGKLDEIQLFLLGPVQSGKSTVQKLLKNVYGSEGTTMQQV